MLVFHIALDGHPPPTPECPVNNFHFVALVGERNFQIIFFQRFADSIFETILGPQGPLVLPSVGPVRLVCAKNLDHLGSPSKTT